MFPNFFIVGTPKAGTTSLFRYLDEHPEVFMCPIKEPNYFAYDLLVEQGIYYSEKGVGHKKDYERLFQDVVSEKAVGEASVSYLFYEKVPARIKAAAPDAKIIVILRNPVERAFSHYLMDLQLGYVTLSFEDIVCRRIGHPKLSLYYQQFVELGFYFEQVKRYLDIFGEEQVRVFINEDLKEDTSQVLLSVYDLLDITPHFMPAVKKQYNVYQKSRNKLVKHLYRVKSVRNLARRLLPDSMVDSVRDSLFFGQEKPELSASIREHLNKLYRNNVLQTGDLIGKDLSRWCMG